MKISKQQLIEMDACREGLDRFIEQTGGTDESVEVLSLIGGKNITSDLLWLADLTLPKDKLVRFACDVALINIEKIKPYTDKYDLIVEFLKNPTADAADAAADAADAGDAAAYAADAFIAAHAAATVATVVYAGYAGATVATTGATQEQINESLAKMFEGC